MHAAYINYRIYANEVLHRWHIAHNYLNTFLTQRLGWSFFMNKLAVSLFGSQKKTWSWPVFFKETRLLPCKKKKTKKERKSTYSHTVGDCAAFTGTWLGDAGLWARQCSPDDDSLWSFATALPVSMTRLQSSVTRPCEPLALSLFPNVCALKMSDSWYILPPIPPNRTDL